MSVYHRAARIGHSLGISGETCCDELARTQCRDWQAKRPWPADMAAKLWVLSQAMTQLKARNLCCAGKSSRSCNQAAGRLDNVDF